MLKQVEEHIQNTFPELQESKTLLACSGGIDSVVLGYCLHQLGLDFGVAHCNFSLRGTESDEDATFVSHLAEKWEVPFHVEVFNTQKFAEEHGVSIQMAARSLRYEWFEQTAIQFQYDFICTAHHADDSLETFLINLSRGTGLKGLLGVPEVNGKLRRPLLPFTRAAIEKFAKTEQLHWREDSSNQSTQYLRNSLRLEVIPKLKDQNTSFLANFLRTQRHLQGSQQLVTDYVALVSKLVIEETPLGYEINIKKLIGMPNYEALLYEMLTPFGFTAWDDIKELLFTQSGKQVVSKKYRLLKDRDTLLLSEIPSAIKKSEKIISENETQIDDPLKMSFIPTEKMGYIDTSTIYVDAKKLRYPLVLRPWKEGDEFQPFGMQGKKKLSKFFKDEKLSLAIKETIWVLESDTRIIWVVGYRADDRFKITNQTNNILKITVSN